jgi:type I restriction enzyme M protein
MITEKAQNLTDRLWTKLDELRVAGLRVTPASEFVGLLAALLYLRWLDHEEAEREAIAAFDDKPYEPRPPSQLRWSWWSSLRGRELGQFIEQQLIPWFSKRTGTSNRQLQLFKTVFDADSEADVAAASLLLEWVGDIDFSLARSRELASNALERILERSAATSKRAESYTPPPIVELMVELADPQPGERVYDPCFGMGGLLVACARRIREAAQQLPAAQWENVKHGSIFGVERSWLAHIVGLTRVVLAGISEPGLELGDALERPTRKLASSERFDVVLANPPWGARPRDSETHSHFRIPNADITGLFLQHIAESLRPGGRAVIVVPEGTLFRPGPDRKIRQWLLEKFRVEGVISLPAGAFQPYTSIKTNLLVFRRDAARKTVRFLVVPHLAGTGTKKRSDAVKASEAAKRFRSPQWGQHLSDFFRSWSRGLGVHPDIQDQHDAKKFSEWLVNFWSDKSKTTPADTHASWADYVADVGDEKLFIELKATDALWETPIKELAFRDWELVAKRSGDDQLRKRLDMVCSVNPGMPVRSLDVLARINSGLSYQKSCTTDDPQAPNRIAPLLRVGDVDEGRIRKPKLFLTTEADSRLDERYILKPGDVVVSTSGSIGKVAIVPDDWKHEKLAAAKSVAVIRPKEAVSGAYLAAILRSDSYQDWLRGHARGSTIQHLTVRTLRYLQIPVPELPAQERVATMCERTAGDALTVLANVLSAKDDDILIWLEATLKQIRELCSDAGLSPPARLDRIAERFSSRANGLDPSFSPIHLNWFLHMAHALEPLRDAHRMRPGAGMFALLQKAHLEIREMRSELTDSGAPMTDVVSRITKYVIKDLEAGLNELLNKSHMTATLEPSSVVAGQPVEMQLRLQLLGPLPLREVVVFTRPDIGRIQVPDVEASEVVSVPIVVPPQESAGQFRFLVRWRGRRLDGSEASDELDLEVDVKTAVSDAVSLTDDDFGSSPYITGSPVDRENMFYGRKDVIDAILRQLSTSHRANVILLEGNRRTGKTSILMHLQEKARTILSDWLVVNCSFQGGEGHVSLAGLKTKDVFRKIATEIAKAADNIGVRTWFPGEEPPDPAKAFVPQFIICSRRVFGSEYPFENLELYLQVLLDDIGPRHLLLMLDEFDKLQEGIDTGVTSPQVPQNIRYLIHNYPRLTAILTGSKRLTRLRQEYWSALFGLGTPVPVRALPLEDARRLVTEPAADRLTFVREARDRIVDLCACQPFLIQTLCNHIFEHQARVKQRTVTERTVDDLAAEMVRDNEHFRTLWDLAETERRRLLLALCHQLSELTDSVTLPLLEAKLEELGVPVGRDENVGDDLLFLRELELIDLIETSYGSEYALTVPVMGDWIRCNVDLEDQIRRARHEAERLQP